jgi:hypothetical protein
MAFCLSLLCCSVAAAACVRPGPAPVVPNGATADDAAMKEAHDSIQSYVNALEAYQSCKKRDVEQAPSDISEETKATWVAQGDAAIDAAQNIALQFSFALKTFKERSAPTAK